MELLAPRGLSRRTLAEDLAARCGGRVETFFHQQQELSLAPDMAVFENLTQGFEVRDGPGALIARCVDDITLQEDLIHAAPSKPGWFRVVSDDARLLRLLARISPADEGPEAALEPMAALFAGQLDHFPEHGMIRAVDSIGAPLAIASSLPGERERPCELITPPLKHDQAARLEDLLAPARALGFSLAAESATHLHFDAARLRNARVFQRLVRILTEEAEALKAQMGANPRCRRLGPWPQALWTTINAPDFADLPWAEAKARLVECGLSKFCDFNLKNIVHDVPGKPTFEVRVLPGLIHADAILDGAKAFEDVLRRAVAVCD
jgi:hypothetical protein